MTTRLIIRVFLGGVLQSEQRLEASQRDLERLLPKLAQKHAAQMEAAPGHVEIEFLDEPDIGKRFFRVGTDPRFMREPLEIDPDDPGAALRKWKGL